MNFEIKSALSGLRQFLVTESLFKIIKNAFYFTLKSLFVDFTSWKINNCNAHIP